MADVVVLATSTPIEGTSSGASSTSYTPPAGTNRLLLVLFTVTKFDGDPDTNIGTIAGTSATFDGVAMAVKGWDMYSAADSVRKGVIGVASIAIADALASSVNVVLTFNGANFRYVSYQLVTLANANPADASLNYLFSSVFASDPSAGTSASASVSVTPPSLGDMVVALPARLDLPPISKSSPGPQFTPSGYANADGTLYGQTGSTSTGGSISYLPRVAFVSSNAVTGAQSLNNIKARGPIALMTFVIRKATSMTGAAALALSAAATLSVTMNGRAALVLGGAGILGGTIAGGAAFAFTGAGVPSSGIQGRAALILAGVGVPNSPINGAALCRFIGTGLLNSSTTMPTVNFNCECNDTAVPTDTLGNLRSRLMVRLGYAAMKNNPPPGMTDLLNDFLISAQRVIYRKYPALRTRRFFRWTMVPGVRFYGLRQNDEDLDCALHMDPYKNRVAYFVDLSGVWTPLREGIPAHRYTSVASRSYPESYEVRQCVEVYPAPSVAGQLWFKGHIELRPFAVDADITTVDSELLFLRALAVAKNHYGAKDARDVATESQTMLGELVHGTHGNNRYIPHEEKQTPPPRPILIEVP